MTSKKLVVGSIANIRYTKNTGSKSEVTDRSIIPTSVPTNIKALDVTGLPEHLREKVADAYKEYTDYINQLIKTAFSFEDWVEHTRGIEITPKWRTFKPDQTKILN